MKPKYYLPALTGILLSLSAHPVLAANKCLALFSTPRVSHFHSVERYQVIEQKFMNLLSSRRLQVVSTGIEKPNWNDYYELAQILETIRTDLKVIPKNLSYLTPAQREQLMQTLATVKLENQEAINKYLTEQMSTVDGKAAYLRFLDYHIAYFRLLKEVNDLVKVNIFPLPNFKLIRSDAKLLAEAKSTVRRLEKIFNDSFEKTGHESLEKFEEHVRTVKPELERPLEVAKNHLVVAMHRPENARFWIPLAGFQNQRITGSSNGSMYADSTPKNISGRDKAEALLTLTPVDNYVPLSARYKPNYAEARPEATIKDIKPNTGASQYGTDLWIIKQSAINERATWTPQDSLGPGLYSAGGKKHYDDIFWPWKFRSLMAPYMYNNPQNFSPSGLSKNVKFEGLSRWEYGSRYFEVQIFGPLSINDVQAFHFQKNPPDKKLYDLLVSKNIEVWDERSWPAKKYNGEESR